MVVHLIGKLLGNGADCEGVFHVAVVWVGGRHEAGVVVDGIIVVQGVAQVIFQLGEKAGGYEGAGCGVHAWFALLREMLAKAQRPEWGTFVGYWHETESGYLATRKADGYYTKLTASGQEFGGNCGRRSHYCCFPKSLECGRTSVQNVF